MLDGREVAPAAAETRAFGVVLSGSGHPQHAEVTLGVPS